MTQVLVLRPPVASKITTINPFAYLRRYVNNGSQEPKKTKKKRPQGYRYTYFEADTYWAALGFLGPQCPELPDLDSDIVVGRYFSQNMWFIWLKEPGDDIMKLMSIADTLQADLLYINENRVREADLPPFVDLHDAEQLMGWRDQPIQVDLSTDPIDEFSDVDNFYG